MKGEMTLSPCLKVQMEYLSLEISLHGICGFIGIPDAGCINVSFQKMVLKLTGHSYNAYLVRRSISQH